MNKKIITILVTIIPALLIAAPAFAITPTTATVSNLSDFEAITVTHNDGVYVVYNNANGAVLANTNPGSFDGNLDSCNSGYCSWGASDLHSVSGFPTIGAGFDIIVYDTNDFTCYNTGSPNQAACNADVTAGTATELEITYSGGGGGGSSTTAIAPFYNMTSTASSSLAVQNEIVTLPIYELRNYETPLIGIGIILAIFGAVFGFLKWFDMI